MMSGLPRHPRLSAPLGGEAGYAHKWQRNRENTYRKAHNPASRISEHHATEASPTLGGMMTARKRGAYAKRWHRSPYEHGESAFWSAGKVPIERRVIQSALPASLHLTSDRFGSDRFSWDWGFSDPLELYELSDLLGEFECGAPFIAPHSNREAA